MSVPGYIRILRLRSDGDVTKWLLPPSVVLVGSRAFKLFTFLAVAGLIGGTPSFWFVVALRKFFFCRSASSTLLLPVCPSPTPSIGGRNKSKVLKSEADCSIAFMCTLRDKDFIRCEATFLGEEILPGENMDDLDCPNVVFGDNRAEVIASFVILFELELTTVKSCFVFGASTYERPISTPKLFLWIRTNRVLLGDVGNCTVSFELLPALLLKSTFVVSSEYERPIATPKLFRRTRTILFMLGDNNVVILESELISAL